MIAWLLLFITQSTPIPPTAASMVEWTGKETWAEALQLLNNTGNLVIDSRAARNQLATIPVLKLPAGKWSFWQALDALCSQAGLQMIISSGKIELVNQEGKRTSWIAYDGPWRAKIVRRSIIAFDDPSLDRFLCQVEFSLEPRQQPLLLTLKSSEHQRSTYNFDGESVKTIEVRLPVPHRSLTTLDSLTVTGEAWLASSRLLMALPHTKPGSIEQEKTKFTLKEIDINNAGKVWTLSTELEYPPGSLEWESHQSRLLSSMKLVLTRGKEQITDVGHDIRTDTGRVVSATWFFRNVPGQPAEWQATLHAPSAPTLMPVKFVFEKIALP